MVALAVRTPVPVGAIPWPRRSAMTLVVKLSFDLCDDGATTLSAHQAPLSGDVFSPDGVLVYPSDWIPRKRARDLVVVGEEARLAGPLGRLSLGDARTEGLRLGPVVAFEVGDAAWASPGFDFARFQQASPSQQVASLSLSLPARLVFSRGAVEVDHRLDFPAPELMIAMRRGAGFAGSERIDVPMSCDTVLLDPRERVVTFVWRGFADPPSGWPPEAAIVVDPFGGLDDASPRSVGAWPRSELSVHRAVARAPSTQPGWHDPREATAMGALSVSAELPFVRGSFAPSRAPAPQAEADMTDAMGTGTLPVGLRSPVRSEPTRPEPIRFEPSWQTPPAQPHREPPAARIAPAENAPERFASPSVVVTPAAIAAPPAPAIRQAAAVRPVKVARRHAKLSEEEVRAIEAELDAAPDDRAEILSRHGLSELMWRLASPPPSAEPEALPEPLA